MKTRQEARKDVADKLNNLPLTDDERFAVSKLIGVYAAACIREDRVSREGWTADQLTRFADVFFNGRKA